MAGLKTQSAQLTLGNGTLLQRDRWHLPPARASDLALFQGAYADLPLDPYLPGAASYRQRRFGRLLYAGNGQRVAVLPQRPFLQTQAVNAVAGDLLRHFEPLAIPFRDLPLLDLLIAALLAQLPWAEQWCVNLHQFRIVAGPLPVAPAPEGIHCDGHDFVALVAVSRQGVSGGVNQVFNADRELLLETTLETCFDYLLLADRHTYHGVTPVTALSETGHRDMLILDFNREEVSL